ncbi:hypothetical protein [Neorhodopirellula lusitana]|nr:hypothetical protein [Neorhodopirellula lusitana]
MRSDCVAPVPESMKAWPGIQSIGQAINITSSGEKETSETRYCISSQAPRPVSFPSRSESTGVLKACTGFSTLLIGEDARRIRTGHAVENMSFTKKFVTY